MPKDICSACREHPDKLAQSVQEESHRSNDDREMPVDAEGALSEQTVLRDVQLQAIAVAEDQMDTVEANEC
jgi:hypothetical protein